MVQYRDPCRGGVAVQPSLTVDRTVGDSPVRLKKVIASLSAMLPFPLLSASVNQMSTVCCGTPSTATSSCLGVLSELLLCKESPGIWSMSDTPVSLRPGSLLSYPCKHSCPVCCMVIGHDELVRSRCKICPYPCGHRAVCVTAILLPAAEPGSSHGGVCLGISRLASSKPKGLSR